VSAISLSDQKKDGRGFNAQTPHSAPWEW